MFIVETIMFNLERANQFFMLIMNRPAVPASLFMELREQASIPGQAPSVVPAGGGPASGLLLSSLASATSEVTPRVGTRV